MNFLSNYENEEMISLYLSGVMLFPGKPDSATLRKWLLRQLIGVAHAQYWKLVDSEKIERYSTKDIAASMVVGKIFGQHIVDLGGWPVLAESVLAKSATVPPVGQASRRLMDGIISSAILLYILKNKTSVEIAADRIVQEAQVDAYCNHETAILNSPEAIRQKAWPKIRPAAHLWAARYVGCPRRAPSLKDRAGFMPLHGDFEGGIPTMIALAEHIRKKACACSRIKNRRHFSDPASAWLPPDDYPLPEIDTSQFPLLANLGVASL